MFAGGFIHLCYAASPAETPARPILRFWFGASACRDVILPAPTDGTGLWIGKVPAGATEAWISPVDRPGPFSFRLLDLRAATISELLQRALIAPRRAFFAISASLLGLEAESDLNWRATLGSQSLSCYSSWRAARRAAVFEQQRSSLPGPAPLTACHVYIEAKGASRPDIETTYQSLLNQTSPAWRVSLTGAQPDGAQPLWSLKPGDDQPGDFILRLRAGDALDSYAIESFLIHAEEHPLHDIVYADEIRAGPRETWRPLRRPQWSPTLHGFVNYIGRAACFRRRLLDGDARWLELAPETLIDALAARATPGRVGSIPRPLFFLPDNPPATPRRLSAIHREDAPSVSLIIPTRDRADLLRPCFDSLFSKSTYPNFEVVLVDNDSVKLETHELIAEFSRKQDKLTVIRAPGPFNFSALSNAGAAAASGEFLIFLNNDTLIETPDWIERLLYFARQPDVGAVGAKLLYPSRKTQHVGVVIGLGGVAGHFGAGLSEGSPGWMFQNLLPHEASAVTGACLMVERRKFDAVGGFDAINLPVDLNDVDLCLRLAEQGWRCICNSQVVLIHHQSASRGGGLRLQCVYEKERRFFLERWRKAIRNDPYFNPGLSLYATQEMLP